MLKIIIVMFSGIATGFLLRHRNLKFISRLIVVLIWVLLFLLGVEVGSDPRIIRSLGDLGIEALVLTLAGLAGSMAMAWVLWRSVRGK